MFLIDLVPLLKASLNAPGAEFFEATDDQWTDALANAFWWGRMRGFFTDYRVDVDRTEIVAVSVDVDDIEPEVAQIVVAIAALNSLEARALSLETTSKAKAGPVEVESGRSAQVIVELIRAKRRELDDIRQEALATGSIYAAVIDSVLAREGAYMCGEAAWVR